MFWMRNKKVNFGYALLTKSLICVKLLIKGVQLYSGAINLIYGLSLHLPQTSVHARDEASGESRISGKGVYMYKGVGLALLILFHSS